MIFRSKGLVFVDLCDTVADVKKAIEGVFGPLPDPLQYYHPKIDPDFFLDPGNRIAGEIFKWAEPIPGSKAGIYLLSQRFRVVYLTARPLWAKGISERWLELNGFPTAPVVCSSDKLALVRKHKPLFVIDDAPANIVALSPYARVLIPAQSWNEGLKHKGLRFKWEVLNEYCKDRDTWSFAG